MSEWERERARERERDEKERELLRRENANIPRRANRRQSFVSVGECSDSMEHERRTILLYFSSENHVRTHIYVVYMVCMLHMYVCTLYGTFDDATDRETARVCVWNGHHAPVFPPAPRYISVSLRFPKIPPLAESARFSLGCSVCPASVTADHRRCSSTPVPTGSKWRS